MEVTAGPKHQSPTGPYCEMTDGVFQFGPALERAELLWKHGYCAVTLGDKDAAADGRRLGCWEGSLEGNEDGFGVGPILGANVGTDEGFTDGVAVGCLEGASLGDLVGASVVGNATGANVGSDEAVADGPADGTRVGLGVEDLVGDFVGDFVVGKDTGDIIGTWDGALVGACEGKLLGDLVGALVVGNVTGAKVGLSDGEAKNRTKDGILDIDFLFKSQKARRDNLPDGLEEVGTWATTCTNVICTKGSIKPSCSTNGAS